ncbi:MAG TPA: hypothetical protein VFH23_16350 [Jiangellaceae bacterium]|nr:hypothetical protein [Jiangellaceae bacterium]
MTDSSASGRLSLAQILEILVAGRLPLRFTAYDGSATGPNDALGFDLVTPRGTTYLATAPGELGLVRAYVSGDLQPHGVHPGDPYELLKALNDSLFPVLKNPANRHRAAGFTPEEFHYSFTNTLSREESDKVYETYHIPAPGNWVWAYGLIANFKPGHQETWVDYANDDRAPLLFITGGADNIMPPSVNKSNAKHYAKSAALTEVFEFPGRSHWTCAEPGWEAVADRALEWAVAHARTTAATA